MQKVILPLLALIIVSTAWSQNKFQAIILDEGNKEPLVGANVFLQGTAIGASADLNGFIEIPNIPDGKQIIVFSYIGYQQMSITRDFPLSQAEPLEVLLTAEAEEMEAVIITTTRSSRTIADIPTRVETISGEELDEKANMKPGDIRMLLNESTGIQTQQTSAISLNSSIRIQGLDGKYTQLLRDGYPLYSGFSGGLGLLQIAPLDLNQVEVVKGASSTLYGGGAIAGLVNLVSRTPVDKRILSFMLNGTSAAGFDASSFYSQKYKNIGTTVFVSYNSGKPYDPADIGLTAIPRFRRFTVNPKLFFYFNDRTTLNIGFNTIVEDRTGGDMKYLEGKGDSTRSYFEKNKTNRISTQSGLDHRINAWSKLAFKSSLSFYDRSIKIPDYEFSGKQISSFSEATYSHLSGKFEWIAGLNLWTDAFNQNRIDTSEVVDYNHITIGAFIQNTWNTSQKTSLETGVRFDRQNEYGSFFLPRLALMIKADPKLTFRFGGGLGYKTPTVFTEDAERLQFRNVSPIDVDETNAEESIGVNFDINYRTSLARHLTFSINSLLFYTRIKDPLVLTPASTGQYEFRQPRGYIDTKGVETNTKIAYNRIKLFVGYTFADVKEHYDDNTTLFPLVARHRLNNVLIYEIEDALRIGLEAYYFSPQKLNDGRTGREYWIFGLMTEKIWENFSLFLNFENFLDTRQTKFDIIYTGSITNPTFTDIYAPVDGFVVNGGFKVRF
jgi:iron complex outermembrane receptor protein